jgi:CDP-diacylglycerol---glycerol-3-phosphate 3-phosphatidyltransferase
MFDGKFRQSVDSRTAPVGRALVRLGFTADWLTASGLVFAAATAVLIGTGYHHWAIVALVITGAHDLFDGPVAKASKSASVRGAFFDSVIDRVSDSLLLGGVAYYLIATHRGQLALLPFGIMTTTYLISYERAKAESLGIKAKGGLMERAERMIVLGIALVAPVLFVPVLWVLLALTGATAIGRFTRVWIAAGRPPTRQAVPPRTRHTLRLRRSLRRRHRPEGTRRRVIRPLRP